MAPTQTTWIFSAERYNRELTANTVDTYPSVDSYCII